MCCPRICLQKKCKKCIELDEWQNCKRLRIRCKDQIDNVLKNIHNPYAHVFETVDECG